jgi:tRNA(fMet)-specific endonuclease VapC
MAKRYLLDTNTVIAGIKGRQSVLEALDRLKPGQIVLSSIVVGELLTGVMKSDHPKRSQRAYEMITSEMSIEVVDEVVGANYARLRSILEAKGTPIGGNDTWIAAHGLALNAIVVTDNTREFGRVPGLVLENWIQRG